MTRTLVLTTALAALVVACSPDADPEAWTSPWSAADTAVVRTADPSVRGVDDGDFPRLMEVAPGVFTYEQLRSSGDERFASVSMFVVTEEGVLVAGAEGSVEEERRLVEQIGRVTDRPIAHVVVSSIPLEDDRGGSVFPAGAIFYAHPSAAEVRKGQADDPDRPPMQPAIVPTTELVDDQHALILGGREMRILWPGRARTAGDLIVHLPQERVVYMGETYTSRIFPDMSSAYPGPWVAAIQRAQSLGADLYIPGRGFVDPPEVSRAELQTFRRAIERIFVMVQSGYARGFTVDEVVDRVDFADLEEWSLAADRREVAVRRVWAQLAGELD